MNEAGRSLHERYGKVYDVITEGNKVVACLFDGVSRSKAEYRLMLMVAEGLVTVASRGQPASSS